MYTHRIIGRDDRGPAMIGSAVSDEIKNLKEETGLEAKQMPLLLIGGALVAVAAGVFYLHKKGK